MLPSGIFSTFRLLLSPRYSESHFQLLLSRRYGESHFQRLVSRRYSGSHFRMVSYMLDCVSQVRSVPLRRS